MEKMISVFPEYLIANPAMITVMGPVGPEICNGVPPNKEAINPKTIAPMRPAVGPKPEAIPNAKANGNATIAEVNPPKISYL